MTVISDRSLSYQRLMQRLNDLGVPYGREDSFKLTLHGMIENRVLIGIDRADMTIETAFQIASELGMPPQCRDLLSPHTLRANAVLFGIEDRADGSVCKLYLEFWDAIKEEVKRTGARTPLLLHLGIKWTSTHPNHHEVARYTCHPMMGTPEAMRRMAQIYSACQLSASCESALAIVRMGAKLNPRAFLLYLEVSEGGNPRHSYDINLYKTGLRVTDVAGELRRSAALFGIASTSIDTQLKRLGPCRLGHLSGGTDRHGSEFLSVYAETQAL